MANVERLSIAVTAEMAAELREAVEEGEYGSVSEAVRDALRDWCLRRQTEAIDIADLRRLIREGIDSEPGGDASDALTRLRAKFRRPPAK